MLRFTHAQFRLTEFHAMLPARDIQTMQYRDSECDPPAISCMCWSCTDADADARCSDLPVKKSTDSVHVTHTHRAGSDYAPIFSARSVSARWCTGVRFRALRFARGNVPLCIIVRKRFARIRSAFYLPSTFTPTHPVVDCRLQSLPLTSLPCANEFNK